MGITLKMFAGENKGKFPTRHVDWDQDPGALIKNLSGGTPVDDCRKISRHISITQIYPEYLSDLQVQICPSSASNNTWNDTVVHPGWASTLGSDGKPRLLALGLPEASNIVSLSANGQTTKLYGGFIYPYYGYAFPPDIMSDAGYFASVGAVMHSATYNFSASTPTFPVTFTQPSYFAVKHLGKDVSVNLFGLNRPSQTTTLYRPQGRHRTLLHHRHQQSRRQRDGAVFALRHVGCHEHHQRW